MAKNYRAISLLCILSQILERFVFSHCYLHISPQLYHMQHVFLKGRTTVIQLLRDYQEIINANFAKANGKEADVIYLDFTKAFDKVSHLALTRKLSLFGITGQLQRWLTSYLYARNQRVTLQGTYSDWLEISSGVPQGSILGPLLFLAHIDEMPGHIKHNSQLTLFDDASKLFKVIHKRSDTDAVQQEMTCLSKWCKDWAISFNTSKCKTVNISKKKLHSRRVNILATPHWTQFVTSLT